ncbi:MAG: hypothetical protein ACLFUJ_03920 [Phycisphaerae bacterium]
MIWLQIVLAFVVAVLLAGALTGGLGRRGPGPLAGFAFFFVLLFLFTWAGGLWLVPTAGGGWGQWVAFPVVGLFLLLILAALVPPARPADAEAPATGTEAAIEGSSIVVGLFFWALLLGLLAAVISYYVTVD